MKSYKKGSNAERELEKFLENKGYACVRSAGSGRNVKSPDLIVGGRGKYFAIEVKATKKKAVYLKEEEVKDLIDFSKKFIAIPVIAVKFNRKGWKFFIASLKKLKYEREEKSELHF